MAIDPAAKARLIAAMARPQILFPLFASVDVLGGVGKRIAPLLKKIAGERVIDLVWLTPTGVADRRPLASAREAQEGALATLVVTIDEHSAPRSPRGPWRIFCTDCEGGTVVILYFRAQPTWLQQTFPTGEQRIVSGRIERFEGVPQIAHPDFVATPDKPDDIPAFETIYPLTQGLQRRTLAKIVAAAVARAPDLPEWQDPAWRAKNGWPSWREALEAVHTPTASADLTPDAPARKRLAYDELLANQLAIAILRDWNRRRRGRETVGDGALRAKITTALPFSLTGDQTRAIAEIEADLARPTRMSRLLQGDVGSGKTVVALMTLMIAVEAGRQGALMAPTEILARQHLDNLAPLCAAAGVTIARLTGRDRGKPRQALLDRLAAGEIDVLVGTHALFSEDVAFRDLAVAVVDEQHRFGVHQRLSLSDKGAADVLVMTATPIPRTLALTAYGDMDVTSLREKPPGRTPIVTAAVPFDRTEEVIARIRTAASEGAQAFWVCPLVEETETSTLTAAEARARHLTAALAPEVAVGLIHGRMAGEDKDRAMAGFVAGETAVLVATTVVEVGVDVPNASIMVIEHAERFGLAQLHQLRGRVGRGRRASTCLLLYAPPLGESAKGRLKAMRDTEDGFVIAEADLQLRGAGEMLGQRQSGAPEFHIADLAAHADLAEAARDDVRLILARDPDLESPRGQALRTLLYLFERDATARYLRSG